MSNQSQSHQQAPQVQAQSDAGQEVLAVACVIDASLALATEWTRVLTAYILPILKRLSEAYNGHQFRLALVTYGAADTYPNPLLSKRFFFHPNSVMKELREDPSKLGLGSANGVRGLSALEGMVAAIELFDILHNSLALTGPKDGRIPVSHIIHIAGCPPDSAQRPAWNTLPHLDSISWNTLPLELKKRKINLSLVTLQQIQQFQDVQSATLAPAPQTNPWFTVYAPHILMLCGFPPLSHVQTPKLSEPSRAASLPFPRSPIPDAAKRPNEAPQTPDTKRQRVSEKSSPALSPRPPGGGAGPIGQRPPSRQVPTPSIPHSALPSQPHSQLLQPSPIPPHATTTPAPSPAKIPTAPAAHPSPAKPPTAPAARPPPNAPNPNAPPTQNSYPPNIRIFEHGKALEVEIKALDAKIQDARSAGNAADVESLQKERNMKYQNMMRLRNMLIQMMASRSTMGGSNSGAGGSGETSQSQSQSQSQPPPQPQLATSNMKSEDAAPPTVSAPISAPMEEQKPLLMDQKPPLTDQALMQTRPGTAGFPSPEVAAQMQKLLNKTGIQPPTFTGLSAPMEEQKSSLIDQKPPLTDQALMQLMQARSGTAGFPSPEVAAQMQKLLNKTGIQPPTFNGSPKPRPAHPPAPGSTSQHQHQPQPQPQPQHQSQHQPQPQPQLQLQSQPQPQASTSTASGGPKQWEGSFTFTIQHAGQPKGLEVQVVALTNSKGQLHAETWPERMFIHISQEGLKDHTELQMWLRKHHQSAVMVQFKPQARNIEQKMNEMVHNVLMKTMAEARTFGVATWQRPCGTMSHNMIVFPMSNGLAGAVFPVTGLPDLPGSSKADAPKPQLQLQPQLQSQPQPQLQLQPQPQPQGVLTPDMLTRLQGLDPEQQRNFMRQFAAQQQMRQLQLQRQRQLQQHQQQQTGAMQQEMQAPAPGVGMQNMSPFSNSANNMPMNMFGGGGVPQRQISGGMHLGGGGTVNNEMMQSFMQRNANGQGMNPP